MKRSLLGTGKKLSLKPSTAPHNASLAARPARTRFAPSPTGFLHLGSLRTALYNYLLARCTGGQFLLRLEDTDRRRLVQGAEQNIYDSLKWCGLHWDEGPGLERPRAGPHQPYRQSERTEIYQQYAQRLIDSGDAYRCFCSKERLDHLRESAQKLQPPTTVSYDRNCAHIPSEESQQRASQGDSFTIRFKSPAIYPRFEDLLHGSLDIQPQVNKDDVRYDDPVLIKSDNHPTYHLCSVVDDKLMEITHVIRGEEWLPSTPKHIALYKAFGWQPPFFIHIPLLTSTKDKKLSKRSGDIDVMHFKQSGILPEALVNFVALFGWSPKSSQKKSEILSLSELEKLFNIKDLTKGNAKVDDKKLYFFNKHYLQQRIQNKDDEIIQMAHELLSKVQKDITLSTTAKLVQTVGFNLTTINEILDYQYLLNPIDFNDQHAKKFLETANLSKSIEILQQFTSFKSIEQLNDIVNSMQDQFPKKEIFQSLRFALTGSIPGLKIPLLIDYLGIQNSKDRILKALEVLKSQL